MILSDNQLTIPGKMYKVRIKCVSTRRLTTIEWLILSCTKKFERLPSMAERTLKYAFEEVFQFQNSELLIKPCLKSLQSLKVIQITKGNSFDYETLKFSDIDLTDLGMIMLKDGLLPGESREIPLSIYYNPLTGKVSSFNNSITDAKDAIEFGTESDYENYFPKEAIIKELQSGAIGSGRFTASKFRIEEIESLVSSDWESTITISADVDEKGVITTTPAIIADGVKEKIQELFTTKEISRSITESLPNAEELRIKNIIGSGKAMKAAFLNVCKNGKVLFIDSKFYNLFKRNTASFKGKTLFLFNSQEGFAIKTIDKDNTLFVQLPDPFKEAGCVAINDKGEHVSFCKKQYIYEDKDVVAPLAVEDDRLLGDLSSAPNWLESISLRHILDDARYAGLFTFPILMKSLPKVQKKLIEKWVGEDKSVAFEEIRSIQMVCSQLGTEMFDVGDYIESILDTIDYSDNKKILDSAEKILSSGVVKPQSDLHRKTVGKIIARIKKPANYIELLSVLRVLGITSHDEALQYDEYVENLYSDAIVKDIIVAIANGTYNKLPEFFELDTFFNDYAECIAQIENHVSGLSLFERGDSEQLFNAVLACPDLAALQSFVAEFKAKNMTLMTKGINVYDVLRNHDSAKAEAYTVNFRELEDALGAVLDDAYKDQESTQQAGNDVSEDKVKRKIYIVDTCAMMHHPEIFLYFSDEEYIRVPTKVIDELGKIKDKRNTKYGAECSDVARTLAREIERSYIRIFNRTNKIRFMIENAALELLPQELDKSVPDNQILSVALKYEDWDTYIISDDGLFRLASMAQNIHPITSEDFIASHKDSYVSLDERIKAYNKAGVTQFQEIENVNRQLNKRGDEPRGDIEKATKTAENVDNELLIDSLPLSELRKYVIDFGNQELTFLNANKIKTLGDFRKLTESQVNGMKAKGKQLVYRNTITSIVRRMDEIIPRIKLP